MHKVDGGLVGDCISAKRCIALLLLSAFIKWVNVEIAAARVNMVNGQAGHYPIN